MPPTLAYTKPQHGNVRLSPHVITNDSWVHSFLKFSQSELNAPLLLRLSSEAEAALGTHNVERFAKILTQKDGWHFGQGKALQAASLPAMESFLDVYNSFPKRCSLFLSEDGNLEMVWRSEGNETTSLEFYPDRIAYYIETLDAEGEVFLNDLQTLVHILAPTA